MPDYQNGQIYSIRSYQTDLIYIGSSCVPLHKRLYEHKKKYRHWQNGIYCYVTSFEIIKFDDAYIELLEDYPCSSKKELNRREGECIRLNECVNKRIEGRTKKEYREENKEQIAKRDKEYKKEHKEQIADKEKEKYDCECGSVVSHGKKARHNKNQKHQLYLASLNQ